MGGLRSIIWRHRWLATLIVAAALCVRIFVPQGYMIGGGQKQLTIQLCYEGVGGETMRIAIPGTVGGHGKSHDHRGSPDVHCPYSSLSMGALSGADVALLALALAFILALGFARPTSPDPVRRRFLQPPLRGPPLNS